MTDDHKTPARSRAVLTGISTRAWEHPADQGALVALRRLKGFDTVLKTMSGLFSERAFRLSVLGSAVRVDDRQFPDLHYALQDAARVLDAERVPELFVAANPMLNAVTVGMKEPFIVLNSGLVDLLDHEELRFVVGHELGHAMSGHAVYQTLLVRLISMTGMLNALPVGGLALRGIVAALYEWSRKSELSADRAGLLATQDPATASRVHMQLASGGQLDQLDPTSFFAQGKEYLDASDLRDSVLKLMLIENRSHPMAVVRAAELRTWIDSGEYARYVGGDYPRRDEDSEAKASEAAKAAASSYSTTFEQTQDSLGKTLHELAGAAGSLKVWLDDKLRRNNDD